MQRLCHASCMTTTCTCGAVPVRAINANIWIADATEAKFGGHYERRDFCSTECVKAAPKYVAPKRERRPVQRVAVGGDWAMVGALLGHKASR